MGRPAIPCRSARPHTDPDADQCRRLLLQFAVERRLCEKSACRLQNFIGAAQFLDLTLKRLDTFLLRLGHARSPSRLHLLMLDPLQQGVGRTANLGRNRLHRRPLRRVFTAMLLHQSHGTLTDLRGKLVVLILAHGSILSRIEASSKPGSIHSEQQKRAAVIELCSRRAGAREVAEAVGVSRQTLYNWKDQRLGREAPEPMTRHRDPPA